MTLLTKAGPGRPRGSKNRITQKLQEWNETFGDAWVDHVWNIATTADKTSDRLMALKILGSKCLPDLKAIEVTGELETSKPSIDVSKLSPEELLVLQKALQK